MFLIIHWLVSIEVPDGYWFIGWSCSLWSWMVIGPKNPDWSIPNLSRCPWETFFPSILVENLTRKCARAKNNKQLPWHNRVYPSEGATVVWRSGGFQTGLDPTDHMDEGQNLWCRGMMEGARLAYQQSSVLCPHHNSMAVRKHAAWESRRFTMRRCLKTPKQLQCGLQHCVGMKKC